MTKEKSGTTNEHPIQVLKQGTCPTSSGKSNLGYEIGIDETGEIQLRVSSNDGGGFFSAEWIAISHILSAIEEWPADLGITSMTFRKIFRGKSANTPGFLVAVLCAEGIIEPIEEKKRVHKPCDPDKFLNSVETLRKGAATASGAKPASKASPKAKAKQKAAPKAKPAPSTKAKMPSKGTAKTAKTPRKARASSRKGK